jgi:hypothetical protein
VKTVFRNAQRRFRWRAEPSGSETASRQAARKGEQAKQFIRTVLPKDDGVVLG